MKQMTLASLIGTAADDIPEIQRFTANPKDIFVLKLKQHYKPEMLEFARKNLAEVLGVDEGRVIVLGDGASLEVIRQEEPVTIAYTGTGTDHLSEGITIWR